MDLWEIIVLAVVRMTLGTNYDRLHHIANYDSLVRGVMGVEQSNFREGKKYGLTTLKENIQKIIPTVVMPNRGKRNQTEYDEEHKRQFKKLENAHSAVESNINQLEYHGLDRCPDKGLKNYRRYVSLGVLAYNLHKLGNLIAAKIKKRQKKKDRLRQAARSAAPQTQ